MTDNTKVENKSDGSTPMLGIQVLTEGNFDDVVTYAHIIEDVNLNDISDEILSKGSESDSAFSHSDESYTNISRSSDDNVQSSVSAVDRRIEPSEASICLHKNDVVENKMQSKRISVHSGDSESNRSESLSSVSSKILQAENDTMALLALAVHKNTEKIERLESQILECNRSISLVLNQFNNFSDRMLKMLEYQEANMMDRFDEVGANIIKQIINKGSKSKMSIENEVSSTIQELAVKKSVEQSNARNVGNSESKISYSGYTPISLEQKGFNIYCSDNKETDRTKSENTPKSDDDIISRLDKDMRDHNDIFDPIQKNVNRYVAKIASVHNNPFTMEEVIKAYKTGTGWVINLLYSAIYAYISKMSVTNPRMTVTTFNYSYIRMLIESFSGVKSTSKGSKFLPKNKKIANSEKSLVGHRYIFNMKANVSDRKLFADTRNLVPDYSVIKSIASVNTAITASVPKFALRLSNALAVTFRYRVNNINRLANEYFNNGNPEIHKYVNSDYIKSLEKTIHLSMFFRVFSSDELFSGRGFKFIDVPMLDLSVIGRTDDSFNIMLYTAYDLKIIEEQEGKGSKATEQVIEELADIFEMYNIGYDSEFGLIEEQTLFERVSNPDKYPHKFFDFKI